VTISKSGFAEQLIQLMTSTWDGDLISKDHRDALVKCGYVVRGSGFNIITTDGIRVLLDLGILRI